MRTELLLRLADLLEADAANPNGVKFDLGDWAHTFDAEGNAVSEFPKDTKMVPLTCDTAACAMGLAAISGAFKAEGLTFEIQRGYGDHGYLLPIIGHVAGFGAAQVLFDIDKHTASHLFDPDHYEKRKGADAELEVAKRLRGLVDGSWSAPDSDDDDNGDEFDDED